VASKGIGQRGDGTCDKSAKKKDRRRVPKCTENGENSLQKDTGVQAGGPREKEFAAQKKNGGGGGGEPKCVLPEGKDFDSGEGGGSLEKEDRAKCLGHSRGEGKKQRKPSIERTCD